MKEEDSKDTIHIILPFQRGYGKLLLHEVLLLWSTT
jgi:hypothetical protein